MMNHTCRICGNRADNRAFLCREKMFGWGDEFTYFQCAGCGCLQISAVPGDLDRFYPAHYYSFHVQPIPQHGWRSRLGALRDYAMATGRGNAGRFINRFLPAWAEVVSLASAPAQRTMSILDVGCGRGAVLSILRRAGFGRLAGIDPYLPNDVEVVPGLFVRKLSIDQVQEKFDLIMLHHVFEHIWQGGEMLGHCCQRLTADGKILLRFPTAESDAWESYRENWVQLDAPRHLFLHTQSSLELLAARTGLKIEKWFCDSTALQFWGSELYVKGIPLFDRDGVATATETYFSRAEIRLFAERAKRVNAAGRGDQVVAILSKTPT
ncbi:MAG: class I SAM-dependent methyltransferase [Limisphaerales bacterium]